MCTFSSINLSCQAESTISWIPGRKAKGHGEIICQNKFYKYSFWPNSSKKNQNKFKLKEKNLTVLQLSYLRALGKRRG